MLAPSTKPDVSLLSEHRRLVCVSQYSVGGASLGEWVE